MIPYLLLLIVPALFCYISIKKQDGRLRLSVGKSEYIRSNNLALTVFFAMLVVMLALRAPTVGRDLLKYEYYFNKYGDMPLKELLKIEPEMLYKPLNRLVNCFTDDYQWMLVVTACLTVAPIAYVYCRDKQYSMVRIAMFVNMSTFVMLFSGLRQSIAMAIGMLAYNAVCNKKPIRFCLLVVLAFLFHQSALVLFIMYPVFYFDFKKKHLWVIVPCMLLIFIFNRQLFGVLQAFYSLLGGQSGEVTSTGAFGSLLMFVALAIFAYLVLDEKEADREAIGLRNLLLVAVAFQCFAPLHSLAMRLNYYYILLIPLAMSKVFKYPSLRYRQVARFGEWALTAFFAVLFVWNIYHSYVTGVSALDTVPYIPFWRH